MITLVKNGGTKTLSNESLIEKLLADGWVEKEESPKKEVKHGKSSKSDNE